MKKRFFKKVLNTACAVFTGMLVFAAASCSASVDEFVSDSISARSASVSGVVSYNDMTAQVRLFSDLQPGFGNAVYFTGTYDGAANWSVAYRGTYVDGKWVLDVPNGNFEWKALTGAWNNGEKVEAPFDGLTWEEGYNKVYTEASVDFNDVDKTTAFYKFYDVAEDMKVYVDTFHKSITQIATVEGQEFVLVTDFSKWNGLMTFAQARKCSELFWKFYPYIYKRLANGGSPTFIRLEFGTSGVAWTSGNLVSVNQEYLGKAYYDFDCLTHEFAHAAQGGWDGNFCPSVQREDGSYDTYMIERFADVIRYEYAYKNGYYNDYVWTLNTIQGESAYWSSVRFWVWIDYTYSKKGVDILQRLNKTVYEKTYARADYNVKDGKAWESIFADTEAAGKSVEDLWKEYANSGFSSISAKTYYFGGLSYLINKYDVRNVIKSRNN